MTTRNALWLICLVGMFFVGISAMPDTASGQPLLQPTPYPIVDSPCQPQGELVLQPSSNQFRYCPEYLVNGMPPSAIANITSIAYAPDCAVLDTVWCGRLFFTSPSTGEVIWVGEYDPALETYPINSFASKLTLPNGLVWHDGSWYVSGEQHIYQLTDIDGNGVADDILTLVNDLPAGSGGWTGSLSIGPDDRLYVTTGTRCTNCPPTTPVNGAILSFALDGSDQQIVATGLHEAFDLIWHPTIGELFATDSAPTITATVPLDEINIINTGADYGWPYCIETVDGTTTHPQLTPPTTNYCSQAESPIWTFPAHTKPTGMVLYTGNAFPEFADDLLVALQGQRMGHTPRGYAIERLCLTSDGHPEPCLDAYGNTVLNENGEPATRQILLPVDLYYGYSLETLNIQQQGFYPEHPVDIAVGPEGQIAISLMEGRIIEITPVESHLE